MVIDDTKKQIKLVQKQPGDAGTNLSVVTSGLPATVIVTAGADDASPINFHNNGPSWDSTSQSHPSRLGQGPDKGCENGNGKDGMGFTC